MLNEAKTKKLNKQGKRVFSYLSADKYIIQIGQASKIKNAALRAAFFIFVTLFFRNRILLYHFKGCCLMLLINSHKDISGC